MTQTTTSSPRWGALALIVTAQFMVILDVAIVNVALPSIKSDLGFSSTSLQWVVSAYAILFGGALLLGGRLVRLERLLLGGHPEPLQQEQRRRHELLRDALRRLLQRRRRLTHDGSVARPIVVVIDS